MSGHLRNIERTPLEVAYDDRIAKLKTALRMGMPANLAINDDTEESVKMDALRERHRGAVEALRTAQEALAQVAPPYTERMQTIVRDALHRVTDTLRQ